MAVSVALEFLEDHAAVARQQTKGVRRRVATAGFAVAGFFHRTSREGDPQLHTHCLMATWTQTVIVGRWLPCAVQWCWRAGASAGVGCRGCCRERVFGAGFEWDAELDLDAGAVDADFFDEEAHQALAGFEVEGVDAVGVSGGEVADGSLEPVVGCEFVPLVGEGLAFGLVAGSAGVELGGAAAEVGEVDESGLVEVDDAAAFGCGGVDLAVEPGELGGEELVVGDGAAFGDGPFAGGEDVGAEQGGADFGEDEVIEGVGSDGPFRASVGVGAGSDPVVFGAVVVVVGLAVAALVCDAGGFEVAGAAADEAAQQPALGLRSPGAEGGVGGSGDGDGVEAVLVDDRGDGDGDPSVAGRGRWRFPLRRRASGTISVRL